MNLYNESKNLQNFKINVIFASSLINDNCCHTLFTLNSIETSYLKTSS